MPLEFDMPDESDPAFANLEADYYEPNDEEHEEDEEDDDANSDSILDYDDDGLLNPFEKIRSALRLWINRSTTCCAHWQELPRGPGIYFVMDGNKSCEVVYVGQSSDLLDRWKQHRLRYLFKRRNDYYVRWKRFDSKHFSSPEHEEAMYIVLLTPKHNQIAKCNLAALSAVKMADDTE